MPAPPPLSEPAMVRATGIAVRGRMALEGWASLLSSSRMVLQPNQILVGRTHRGEMVPIAIPAIARKTNCIRIPPTMHLDVPIDERQRTRILMFHRGPVPEQPACAHKHDECRIADVDWRGIYEGINLARTHRGKIGYFLKGITRGTARVVRRGIFPSNVRVERIVAQSRQILATGGNRCSIGRAFIDRRSFQV